MASASPAVKLVNVSKSFGNFTAVKDMSLEIQHGEILGIIGLNGAGKTTTVNMIFGMFPPSSGMETTLGLNPTKESRELREMLGMQFQEARLPNMITVEEALKLYSSLYNKPVNWRSLAEEWGNTSRLDAKFEKLSGGQKQRLFICLALLNNPSFVVLDELTTGLDPHARRQSWELVKQMLDLEGRTLDDVLHSVTTAPYPGESAEMHFVSEGDPVSIGRVRESLLVRSLQEALRNVRKHANAHTVTVTLSWLEDEVLLDVSDDGVGFDPLALTPRNDGYRVGLINMQARIEEAGGTFVIDSAQAEGSAMTISFSTGKDS